MLWRNSFELSDKYRELNLIPKGQTLAAYARSQNYTARTLLLHPSLGALILMDKGKVIKRTPVERVRKSITPRHTAALIAAQQNKGSYQGLAHYDP